MKNVCESVIKLARARGVTIGTAESLTGGMICASLTSVPGASEALRGGIVSYMPCIKHKLLGVSLDTINLVGVVSEGCAVEMALGAREALDCDIAVSATGLAGPGGGTDETPVGTVFLGIATEKGARALECHFSGDRESVRRQASRRALELILDTLG